MIEMVQKHCHDSICDYYRLRQRIVSVRVIKCQSISRKGRETDTVIFIYMTFRFHQPFDERIINIERNITFI